MPSDNNQNYLIMNQTFDLNAELREWLSVRLKTVLAETPDNIRHISLDISQARYDIFRLVYDYQLKRQWPCVAKNTALITGIERSTTYKMLRKCKKHSP